MTLTDDEYTELAQLRAGSLTEWLDLLCGEKPAAHGKLQKERDGEQLAAFFEPYGYTVEYFEDPVPGPDTPFPYVFFIAETAYRAAELQSEYPGSVTRFGELLGYPDCCIEHATANMQPGLDEVIPEKVTHVGPYPFYTNRFLRLTGITLLSHFPCHYGCDTSIETGRRRYELLKQYQPEEAATYKDALQSFVIYHDTRGVLYASDYTRDGDTVQHDGFEIGNSRTDEAFLDTVNATDEVVVNGPNSVTVSDETIADSETAVAFFE